MMYDAIIAGAGAAGLMTAITAARGGAKVVVLDGQKQIGAKILMSGGTRCNVTNTAVTEKDYNSHQLMRVRNIVRSFDNTRAIRFFQELGVELVLEPTGKYFPVTHSGKTVLDALVNECRRLDIAIKTGHKVTSAGFADGSFTVRGSGFALTSRALALTTGGLSYPGTGSDGTGYRIAQSFGHTVLTTMPALTPLTTDDKALKDLSGISLPVTLSLWVGGKRRIAFSDDFLFTHLGFSGPAALDLSRHWVGAQESVRELFVNFLPPRSTEQMEGVIQRAAQEHPRKTLKNFTAGLLPQRLAAVLLAKCGIAGDMTLNGLSKEARRRLAAACTHYALATAGVVGYSKAEVTAGGIDLSEVNPKTLESKLQAGLFFAGEILDVDGRIGGFNFQWAWASGHCAGQALVVQTRKEHP